MEKDRVLIVIPARYQSSRIPGKPLIDFYGKPMIVRTWERVMAQADGMRVVVATNDQRIFEAVGEAGAQVVMTSDDCSTGTDRVWQAAQRFPAADIIVNVQGDEPCLCNGVIRSIIESMEIHKESVCCGMAPIVTARDLDAPSVGKVVVDKWGYALYMSRARIPFIHSGHGGRYFTQVCVYGFARWAIELFAALPVGTLELIEGIEMLRLIEQGVRVRMVSVPGERLAVDVPEDIERVRAEWKKRHGAI